MRILGLDIGYSNLKLAYGSPEGMPKQSALPAGAGLASTRSMSMNGPQGTSVDVTVNGDTYSVGVPQSEFPSAPRQLSDDYSRTAAYKALFYGALALQEEVTIDHLVTGLPVNIFRNKDERDKLISLMKGEHKIRDGKSVNVKSVDVIAQPIGSYFSAIEELASRRDGSEQGLINSSALVIDIGFYSFDYALIDRGQLISNGCGNNCHAMSSLLEETQKLLSNDGGGVVHISNLEQQVRENQDTVYFGLKPVSLSGYKKEAGKKVASLAVKELKNKLRNAERSVNLIILTGGGASEWKPLIEAEFNSAEVFVPANPVTANAVGFFAYGRGYGE
jgi:plasmid segregation protein ParM